MRTHLIQSDVAHFRVHKQGFPVRLLLPICTRPTEVSAVVVVAPKSWEAHSQSCALTAVLRSEASAWKSRAKAPSALHTGTLQASFSLSGLVSIVKHQGLSKLSSGARQKLLLPRPFSGVAEMAFAAHGWSPLHFWQVRPDPVVVARPRYLIA